MTNPTDPSCKAPLRRSDFPHYDVVPDGNLYHSELDANALKCFILRYLHTNDKEVRLYFLKSIRTSLWEIIRDDLAKNPPKAENKAFAARLDQILTFEFSKQALRMTFEAEGQQNNDQEDTRSDGNTYSFRKRENQLNGIGSAALKLPLPSGWRFSTGLKATGRKSLETQDESSDGRVSSAEYSYFSHKFEGDLKLFRKDENATWATSGTWDRYYSPSPDHLENHLDAFSSLELRTQRFSLKGTGNFLRERSSPPPVSSNFFRKSQDTTAINAESTVRMGAWGGSTGLFLLRQCYPRPSLRRETKGPKRLITGPIYAE